MGRESSGGCHEPFFYFPISNFSATQLCLVNSRGIFDNLLSSTRIPDGAMVQRLARGPFKAEIRVRFPLALP